MLSIREIIKKGSLSLLDLVYPSQCVLCEERLAVEEAVGICPLCFSQIPHNIPPYCWGCGRSYAEASETSRCGACEGKVFLYDRLWFVVPYEEKIRTVLHQLKYGGKRSLIKPLSSLLIAFSKKELPHQSFDAILPVPLAQQKEKERTFNQSYCLAEALSKALSIPLFENNLIRSRETTPQFHLSRKERFQNVAGAFDLREPSLFSEKHLLIIDDLITTGATLSACAALLREAGAKRISALTLARG